MAKTVLVPGSLANMPAEVTRMMVERGFTARVLGDITADDIDRGYAHIDNDVCVATAAIVGQYVRAFESAEFRDAAVLAPELCRDCRAACTPALLKSTFERAGYTDVEIVGFSSLEVRVASSGIESEATIDPARPVVGVCGNVPVITTEAFNRVVVDHLLEEGCQVVMPPVNAIANLKDFLTPAIEYFDELDINTVICILPFGCLGGHVYARGQVRKMQKRFGNIGITMLDYDPSASDINLVNRTELVIQAAKERLA